MACDTGEYKLRCSLSGHLNDIRNAESNSAIALVTVSRDHTAVLWTPEQNEYKASRTLYGHSNFVACVTITPPNSWDRYPEGLIYTGSFDTTIKAYTVGDESTSPVFTLSGHKKPVCSLSSNNTGHVISGSWDSKLMVWHGDRFLESMDDHANTVWATTFMPDGETIVTGSADKTVKVWNLATGLQSTFRGHDECVRTIAVLGDKEFLSGGNDCRIIHWNTTSGLITAYIAHDNFIYSISSRSDYGEWSSVSEDGTLKVWRENKIAQTIALPMVTPWVVKYMWNDDLAVAGSDGLCHIFTKRPDRVAEKETLEALDRAVSEKLAVSSKRSADEAIDINTLAGPEALLIHGVRVGQQKIIRQNDSIVIYQWDGDTWKLIGDVTGVKKTPNKKMHKGKEYDFIIDVDAVEGQPPLKLPFNNGQDPWAVAQQFIYEHNLSQGYLDTIANFIIKNTNAEPSPLQSTYQDPFTGESRYVPGNPVVSPKAGGDHKYEESASGVTNTSDALVKYMYQQYKHQTAIKVPQVIAKLVALNDSENLNFPKEEIEALAHLIDPNSCTNQLWVSLINMYNKWPVHINFPLLDLVRVAAASNQCLNHLKDATWFRKVLLSGVSDVSWNINSVAMVFRTISNLFHDEDDNNAKAELAESALNSFSSKFSEEDLNFRLQQAVSNCATNYALYLHKEGRSSHSDKLEERKVTHLECLMNLLSLFNDEASVDMLCRGLCALFENDDVIKVVASQKDLVTTLLVAQNSVSSSETKMMIKCLCKVLLVT